MSNRPAFAGTSTKCEITNGAAKLYARFHFSQYKSTSVLAQTSGVYWDYEWHIKSRKTS